MVGRYRHRRIRTYSSTKKQYNPGYQWLFKLLIGLLLISLPVIAGDANREPHWVFLSDKNIDDPAQVLSSLENAESILTERAISRRFSRSEKTQLEVQDLPIDSSYLNNLIKITGSQPRVVSRWLNAVSFDLFPEQVGELTPLPFITEVKPVASFVRSPTPEVDLDHDNRRNAPRRDDHVLDYGNTYLQNAFLRAPDLHDLGYFGEGILIGITDTGFNNLDHVCFDELEVVTTRDFINDDDDVGDGGVGNGDHGTQVLSIIAGFEPGRYIGIAPRASFVLAKTECTEWERRVEEDYWIAAVEWMDSLGVDIISVSLSYHEWYDYEHLDGVTAPITRVANRAVEVGMIVVVSMGNRGRGRYPDNKMGAPADGFGVFSIGALEHDSTLSVYSSIGPTYDGRIKPDFTTLGTSVRVASPEHDQNYRVGAGTSFSAPAISGLCALLLETNDHLTPVTIGEILRDVSHNQQEPDTTIGWGIPDGLEAFERAANFNRVLVIHLEQGWNIISHNLHDDLERKSIPSIFESIVNRGHLTIVRDAFGNFYLPNFDFNNIPYWHPLQGYFVRVNTSDSLIFEGLKRDVHQIIPLEQGWHLVAYLPDYDLNAEVAFNSLVIDQALVLARDHNGGFYLPEHGFCDMLPLTPGRGYQVHLRHSGFLIYPDIQEQNACITRPPKPQYFPLPDRTAEAMYVLVYAGDGIKDGDEMGFFNMNNELIGSGVFANGMCGVALWGEAGLVSAFPEVSLYKSERDELANPLLTWMEGCREYKVNEYSVIIADLQGLETDDSINDFTMKAVPNPFNNSLSIRYNVGMAGSVNVVVFDLLGREIASRSEKAQQGGVLLFDTDDWSAGSYIVRMTADESSKQLLVKHIK